jgi:hypothetical protein
MPIRKCWQLKKGLDRYYSAIWDSYGRSALVHTDTQTTWESYEAWLVKFRQEVDDHKAGCLEQVRLPGESLVRTLDKALYIIGQRIQERQEQLKERAKRP